MAFIDLTKANDSVNREALWSLLIKYGIPQKVVNISRNLHQGMTGIVRLKEEVTENFEIKNGLMQGCVIAPKLFNLFFAKALAQALDTHVGVSFRF